MTAPESPELVDHQLREAVRLMAEGSVCLTAATDLIDGVRALRDEWLDRAAKARARAPAVAEGRAELRLSATECENHAAQLTVLLRAAAAALAAPPTGEEHPS